jgi:amino acid transporter
MLNNALDDLSPAERACTMASFSHRCFCRMDRATLMSSQSFETPSKFKRSLTFEDLVIYGVLYMVPIAPFGIYGFVSLASSGAVALTYFVALMAMLLTAYSYKVLAEEFRMGGSAYAYARESIGSLAGFFTGWLLVLDYLLSPALAYVVGAAALSDQLPAVPRWLWVMGLVTVTTTINYLGGRITVPVNKFLISLQFVVIAVFTICGLLALYGWGVGSGHLSFRPLLPPNILPSKIAEAASICVVSFLGFDAISTLADEVTHRDRRNVGNAIVTALAFTGVIFICQVWVAADLADGRPFRSVDTAFYEIAGIAGGQALASATVWATTLSIGIALPTAALGAIARLLLSMAQDRNLPAALTKIHSRFNSPHVSLLVVAALCFVIALAFLYHIDLLAQMLSFGALTSFIIVHVALIRHFMTRKRSRHFLKHLACPLAGVIVLIFVLCSIGKPAWILGISWIAVGIGYRAVSGWLFSPR